MVAGLAAAPVVWADPIPSAVPAAQSSVVAPVATPAAHPVPVIVVVDPQAAIQQSKAGQTIRAARDKYLQSVEGELQADRKTLSDQQAELNRQKGTLPFDEMQKRSQAFDQRVMEFNQKFQKINLAVDKSYRAALTDLSQAFTQSTAEVANEAGATLVLPIQQVILHDPHMDLTKQVIERMDARFPTIAFPPPEFDTGTKKSDGPVTGKK